MLERLGNGKFAVPLVAAIAIACVMSLMFFPMANMEMKGLPFAVLSLDEGVEGPQGTVNAGEAIVEGMMAAADDGDSASPIAWTQVASQEELDEALENGEFYGAVVVPAGFSADQMAAKQAEAQAALAQAQALAAAQAQAQASGGAAAEAGAAASQAAEAGQASPGAAATAAAQAADAEAQVPTLKVILDNAKSPLVASQMKTGVASMFQQLGVGVEVETIHTGDAPSAEDGEAASPMAGMMSQQLTIMPLFMISMVGALILSRVLKAKPGAARAERWKSLGVQGACAIALSLAASLCAYCMLRWVAGVEAPFADFALFMWLASFCVMLLFLGAFNLSPALWAVVAVCAFAGGMACGVLPYETLPAFWQDWVYPWAPQRFIGEGLRAVLYLGEGAWNVAGGPLLAIGATGAALAVAAGLVPARKRTGASAGHAASAA